jgi:hypothetical protein
MDIGGAGDISMVHNETNVIIPIEEFAHDLEVKLGRANGNVYVRSPGVEGLHDGQIMVRLKKKRFIIIDYSIVPTPTDIAAAAVAPHVMVGFVPFTASLFTILCDDLLFFRLENSQRF